MSSQQGKVGEEVRRVLELVAAGTLSPDSAALILDALSLPAMPGEAPGDETGPSARPGADVNPPGSSQARPHTASSQVKRPVGSRRVYHTSPATKATIDGLQQSRRKLSREVRRLSREAKRISHEASRASKKEMREAIREAKDEIRRAFRLSVGEARRAIADVESELKTAFSAGLSDGRRDDGWLANLARLGVARDQVKHVARSAVEHEMAPGERVTVRNFAGDVVVNGWHRSSLELRAERTGWGADSEMAQDRAEGMPLDVQRREGEILIEAHPAVASGMGLLNLQRMRSNLTISVPRDINLAVTTKGGDVIVDGHVGQLTVITAQGDAAINGAAGAIDVETVQGEITLRECTSGRVAATSVSGDIIVYLKPQPGGEYRLRSADGDVVAHIVPGAALEYELETVSGDLNAGGTAAVLARQPGYVRGAIHPAPGAAAGATARLHVVTINGDASVS